MTRKCISILILTAFISTSVKTPVYAQMVDPMPRMPAPGVMVRLSPEFTPAYLKGIVIHPENALKFDFIIYKGDKELTDAQKKQEYTKLTKYFLASLAIPDDDQWVNLSPYEKDRIIKDDFGKTEMGRDLLAQDYLLKQVTASLIYPQDNLGKKFWDRVYAQAQEQYGTTNIPVNTFNKVWILPDDALIYEKGDTAYVLKNHLKVMLEEDYLALKKHAGIQSAPAANKTHSIASKIVKEIVFPELEREVNEGENFAAVRQVYSGMLLAAWYKRELKETLLSRIYANKAKIKGVDQDPATNEKIYRQYLRAYKKGVFNFIKEDVDKYTNEIIPRKYFSGGAVGYTESARERGVVEPFNTTGSLDPAQMATVQDEVESKDDLAMITAEEEQVDAAMKAEASSASQDRATMSSQTEHVVLPETAVGNLQYVRGSDADGNYWYTFRSALDSFIENGLSAADAETIRKLMSDLSRAAAEGQRLGRDIEINANDLKRAIEVRYRGQEHFVEYQFAGSIVWDIELLVRGAFKGRWGLVNSLPRKPQETQAILSYIQDAMKEHIKQSITDAAMNAEDKVIADLKLSPGYEKLLRAAFAGARALQAEQTKFDQVYGEYAAAIELANGTALVFEFRQTRILKKKEIIAKAGQEDEVIAGFKLLSQYEKLLRAALAEARALQAEQTRFDGIYGEYAAAMGRGNDTSFAFEMPQARILSAKEIRSTVQSDAAMRAGNKAQLDSLEARFKLNEQGILAQARNDLRSLKALPADELEELNKILTVSGMITELNKALKLEQRVSEHLNVPESDEEINLKSVISLLEGWQAYRQELSVQRYQRGANSRNEQFMKLLEDKIGSGELPTNEGGDLAMAAWTSAWLKIRGGEFRSALERRYFRYFV